MTLRISDHALLRILERVHGVDVEAVRAQAQASLERAAGLTAAIGVTSCRVCLDGYVYVVRGGTVTTVVVGAVRTGERAR